MTTFDASGNRVNSYDILQLRNGTLVQIGTYDPSTDQLEFTADNETIFPGKYISLCAFEAHMVFF